jgi:hypothetical protein
MSILTKAARLLKINTLFADNTNHDITEAELREVTADISDSSVSDPSVLGAAASLDGTEVSTIKQGGVEVSMTQAQAREFANKYDSVAGMLLTFVTKNVRGTTGVPETAGAFTVDLTNAVRFTEVLVIHQRVAEPTYPASFKKWSGTYDTAKLNYYKFTYIDATHICYEIKQHP